MTLSPHSTPLPYGLVRQPPYKEDAMITASDARRELVRLNAERLDALASGPAADRDSLSDLDAGIADCRMTYELLALTEIASLRAKLFGPQIG